MKRIRARLKNTSQSWIASIVLVLNLVKLAGMAHPCLGFSAWEGLKNLLFPVIEWLIGRVETKNQRRFNSGLVLKRWSTLVFQQARI